MTRFVYKYLCFIYLLFLMSDVEVETSIYLSSDSLKSCCWGSVPGSIVINLLGQTYRLLYSPLSLFPLNLTFLPLKINLCP